MECIDVPFGAKQIKFMVALNDPGSASFVISLSKLKAASTTIEEGDQFRIKVFDNYCFTFIWENTQKVELENEDYDLTISGSGVTGQLERVQLWPDKNTNKYNTAASTFQFDDTFTITYPWIQGIYLRSQNNKRNCGKSVGEVWNTLIADAVYRNSICPTFVGYGKNDAASNAWDSFAPTGFNFEIGTNYLSILNYLADKGFLFYRQEEVQATNGYGKIYLYKTTTPFNSIDITAEAYRCNGFTENTSIKKKYNAFLILDKNVITSYRNPYMDEVEGTIALEMSNNPNIHGDIAQSFLDEDDTTKKINMVMQKGKLNPVIDFTVGDRLVLTGKLNNNRIMSIAVSISDDMEAHVAEIEMGADLPADGGKQTFTSKRPLGVDLKKSIDELKRKSNPTTATVTATNISSDGKKLSTTNSDGTTSTLEITDIAIIVNGVSIPKGVLL